MRYFMTNGENSVSELSLAWFWRFLERFQNAIYSKSPKHPPPIFSWSTTKAWLRPLVSSFFTGSFYNSVLTFWTYHSKREQKSTTCWTVRYRKAHFGGSVSKRSTAAGFCVWKKKGLIIFIHMFDKIYNVNWVPNTWNSTYIIKHKGKGGCLKKVVLTICDIEYYAGK